jgi:hypothetical protein
VKGERTINRTKNIFSVSVAVVRNSLQTAKLKGYLSILGVNRSSSSSTKHLDGLRGSPSTSVGTKGSCFGGKRE